LNPFQISVGNNHICIDKDVSLLAKTKALLSKMKLAVFLAFCTASALADPIPDSEVVGSVVSPISFGAIYTGIHNVDTTHTPGTISYGAPKLAYYGYYGRKKREAEPDPDVVGSVVSPISFGAIYTGIHNVDTTHTPGTITYGTPKLVYYGYYGRKKREAEPDPEVVGSVVSPISYGPLYAGIHSVAAKHIPGTVAYSAPSLFYYGRKKREAEPDVVGSVVSPYSFGAVYTGIHNVEATHIPGAVTYGQPLFFYYGRK